MDGAVGCGVFYVVQEVLRMRLCCVCVRVSVCFSMQSFVCECLCKRKFVCLPLGVYVCV